MIAACLGCLWTAAAALAADADADADADAGTCTDGLAAPTDPLSVAWVSPLRDRARGKAWLYVVPTAELRRFAAEDGHGDSVRTLQWLGLRRSARPLHRRFKVVVFDTRADALCRPIAATSDAAAGPVRVASVATCADNLSEARGHYAGCGRATDLRTDAASIEVFRAQWNALAVGGFCLLPLDRFVTAPPAPAPAPAPDAP